MPPAFTQENRQLAIATPLGQDVLLLKAFTLTDELTRPFRCECELRSVQHAIEYNDIVGKEVALRVVLADGTKRYISGVVSRFGHTGTPAEGRMNDYAATVVPLVWFLSRTSSCRIFQKLSVPDIIEQVLKEFGQVKAEFNLKGTYPKRDFVVQYRETALDFITRLMEDEGIFYYFRHEESKHIMLLCDDPAAHEPATGLEKLVFEEQEDFDEDEAIIFKVTRSQVVATGKVQLRDYDFKAPNKLLDATTQTVAQKHSVKSYEIYDFPGSYDTNDEGKRYAGLRMQEIDAMHEVHTFETSARALVVGCKFTLDSYPVATLNREYVVTGAVFSADGGEFGSLKDALTPARFYRAVLRGIPASTPYRTPRLTPKPRISGPQTAFVVGPSGEEIHTDEFGRVLVQFIWDREGQSDQKSSFWIRVSQGWAGKRYGMTFLPRVGHEVIVEFLEGDPDRPIITGRVYNGGTEGLVPYKLPDNKTMSTMKSCSSKGAEGFNEIRFEDKKGSEHIFVHAEKDYHERVKNDRHELIANDRHLTIGKDQIEHVKNDRSETVDRDHKELVKRDRNLKVNGKEAVEVIGSKSLKVTGDVIEVFGANQSTTIKGDLYIKAKNICFEAATNITIKVGSTHIAIEKDSIKIGAAGKIEMVSEADTTIKSQGKIAGEATGDVTFKSSGGNFKAEGAINAEIKAGVGAKLEGGATADVKGPMASLKGDATAIVKGGVVMIN